jgi:MFS family permease
MMLPIRGVLAFFVTGWWGVVPMQVLDGIGTGLQTVAVPGMVARSLNGTGRINLGQGAVITVQGVGASLSPALGGWIAQWIGYGPTFLLLGGFGLASMALWLAFGTHVKKY